MVKVILGIGTNLGDRKQNLRKTIIELKKKAKISRKSSIYETEPMGYLKQEKFLNMVVEIETSKEPEVILNEIQEIEKEVGRVKRFKNGPREIDIDILFYGNRTINEKNLKIPHVGMEKRNFVMVPLVEIRPRKIHPTLKKTAKSILESFTPKEWIRKK